MVYGQSHANVSQVALAIGLQLDSPAYPPPDAPGVDVFVAFAGQGTEDLQPAYFMGCTDPQAGAARLLSEWLEPVSYTHLDVYKRQGC